MSSHHPDSTSHRRLQEGDIVGFSFNAETHAWWGIPYASPPVGHLRWRAPRKHAPWEGVRECLRYGAMGIQLKSFMTASPVSQWNKPVGSEDCLTLNVFAPKTLPAEPLPVMVWIHGGGNTGGASSMYSIAGNLPAHGNVIVVSVNYRLGVFGWFYHPAIFDETCTPEDKSGNFGTLDLIAALRWVKENISNFGGNPENITIFGESAGGQNVLSLYVSPLAKGLFQKAIAQSPISFSVTLEQGFHHHEDTPTGSRGNSADVLTKLLVAEGKAKDKSAAKALLNKMSEDEIRDYLYHKDAEQIITMYNGRSAGIYDSPRLFQDGVVLPSIPLLEAFGDSTCVGDTPLIIGSNRDEMKLFMMMNPEYITMRFGKVPVMRNQRRYELDAEYFSHLWKAAGVDEPLQRLYRTGQKNIYVYRFDWDEIPPIPFIRPDILIGATHATEISFVFRDLAGQFNPFRTFTKRNEKSRISVASTMSQYWINFAHSGNPNDGTLPEWMPWQWGINKPQPKNTLVIDSKNEGGIRMESIHSTFEEIKNLLRQDKRLSKNVKERCRLYAQMFLYGGLFGNAGDLEEYETFGRNNKAPIPATAFRSSKLL